MQLSKITSGAEPMLPEPYSVRSVTRETHDTFTLLLDPPPPHTATETFQPGQFSMLWAFGVGEIPVSISGDSARHDQLIYTIRSVGQVSKALVCAEPGASVGVRGHFGKGWPLEEARGRDVVLVAGGIGLAPLRPVIYQVMRERNQYGRLLILYGTRTPRDLLFRKEIVHWAKQEQTQVLTTVDSAGLSWRGHVGVVTKLFRYAQVNPSRSIAMMCGPEVMMRFAARELEAQGLAAADIYLSMERNMKCAVGFCGHCQWGPHFICKDGPVFTYGAVRSLMERYEL